MELFQVIFRSTIHSIVIGVWGLILLALLVGGVTRIIGFAWRFFHPIWALAPIRSDDDVVDAEWVREI